MLIVQRLKDSGHIMDGRRKTSHLWCLVFIIIVFSIGNTLIRVSQ